MKAPHLALIDLRGRRRGTARARTRLVGMACAAFVAAVMPSGQAPAQDTRKPAIGPAIGLTALPTHVDPAAIALPAPVAVGLAEQWGRLAGDRIIRNVVSPTVTPFLPARGTATGAAVVVAPGGGFMLLSIDNEGYDVARWLAAHGIAAFVLKYRTNATPRDEQAALGALAAFGGKLAAAGPDDVAAVLPIPAEALADAGNAVKLVRARAGEWGIDPRRVGFMGFSAGGITALGVGLGDDRAERPDFIAPIYGPMIARAVPADAPPMFTAFAADDPLMGRGALAFVQSYKAAKRPVELHLYDSGGHGFGMKRQGRTSDRWIEQFHAWMNDRGLLKR